MGFLDKLDVPPRRADRRHCPHCGTSATTCRGLVWLSNVACCAACPRDHDGVDTREPEGSA